MATRTGTVGQEVTLRNSFYHNGTLFTPFSVSDVDIYDAASGGTLVTSITPTEISTGVFRILWTPNVAAGTYYDEWTWVAQSGMSSKTQRYDFLLRPALTDPGARGLDNGPLFVGTKEVSFFNCINKELIQKIVGQKVIYYAVSEEHTNSHRLYDEAIRKTTYRPVEINARVLFMDPVQSANEFSLDTINKIEVYFHVHELEERNIRPRTGDFVKFGNIVYEILHITIPQIVYGQINNKLMLKAECQTSRKSNFKVLDSIPGY